MFWTVFLAVAFWLMVGHALMDFSLQTSPMAIGKNWNSDSEASGVPWYYWMTSHCLLHGGMVALITGLLPLGLLEFALHFIIDCMKCAKITTIHSDQFFHVVCKLLWAAIATGSILQSAVPNVLD